MVSGARLLTINPLRASNYAIEILQSKQFDSPHLVCAQWDWNLGNTVKSSSWSSVMFSWYVIKYLSQKLGPIIFQQIIDKTITLPHPWTLCHSLFRLTIHTYPAIHLIQEEVRFIRLENFHPLIRSLIPCACRRHFCQLTFICMETLTGL